MAVDTDLLIHTVTIERPDRAHEGTMVVASFDEIATGVSCRIEQLSGRLDPSVLGRFPTVTHRIYFNTADVQTHDRLTDADGKIYFVQDVNTLYGDHIETLAEEKPV